MLAAAAATIAATWPFILIAAAVLAVAVIVVAIALTFKGPDVAKRVIRKV